VEVLLRQRCHQGTRRSRPSCPDVSTAAVQSPGQATRHVHTPRTGSRGSRAPVATSGALRAPCAHRAGKVRLPGESGLSRRVASISPFCLVVPSKNPRSVPFPDPRLPPTLSARILDLVLELTSFGFDSVHCRECSHRERTRLAATKSGLVAAVSSKPDLPGSLIHVLRQEDVERERVVIQDRVQLSDMAQLCRYAESALGVDRLNNRTHERPRERGPVRDPSQQSALRPVRQQ